jgi:hypothetical protein
MIDKITLLDVVALTEDLPQYSLHRGQVGTVVEVHRENAFEIEFVDPVTGRTYAVAPARADQLILLHYAPVSKD